MRLLTPLPNDTDVRVNVQGRDVPGRVNSSHSSILLGKSQNFL